MAIAWVPVHVDNWDPRMPQGRAVLLRPEAVRATIERLRHCRMLRAADYRPAGGYQLTCDPEWLVDMAINRRAGWPDDPSSSRGSAMPVGGKYPRRAEGDTFMLCWRLARRLADRIITRTSEVGGVPRKVRERVAHRLYSPDDF